MMTKVLCRNKECKHYTESEPIGECSLEEVVINESFICQCYEPDMSLKEMNNRERARFMLDKGIIDEDDYIAILNHIERDESKI